MNRKWFTTSLVPALLLALSAPVFAQADDAERERLEEERQRMQEERQRAAEEKQRAREEAQRAREEAQRARDEAQREREHEREEAQRAREEAQREREGADDDKKSGRTSAKVKGPVRFQVEVVNADVVVTATGKDTVSISAKNCGAGDLELDGADTDFEADFSEWGTCEGPVVVIVPVGSSVEVDTVQGSVRLKGTYKEVEVSSVAGDIEVEAADTVEAEAVQGKVKIGSGRRVSVESVAGSVEIVTTGTAPVVDVETVNGDVRWTGACGKGCRASIESFQGSSTISLDAKTSSFELRFATESGKFTDGLGTKTTSNKKNVRGYTPVRSSYGKSEGSIRVETYQGDLSIKKR